MYWFLLLISNGLIRIKLYLFTQPNGHELCIKHRRILRCYQLLSSFYFSFALSWKFKTTTTTKKKNRKREDGNNQNHGMEWTADIRVLGIGDVCGNIKYVHFSIGVFICKLKCPYDNSWIDSFFFVKCGIVNMAFVCVSLAQNRNKLYGWYECMDMLSCK